MSWSDSNMSGNEWAWEIFATKRKDGTLSTGARQRVIAGPEPFRVRGTYCLRTGAQVKDAIETLFSIDALEGMEPDWGEIVNNVGQLSRRISREVQAALDQQARQQEEDEAAAKRDYERLRPIREWVGRAKWPHSTSSGAGGMVRAVENGIRRNAVMSYTTVFLERHGRFPTGEHNIDDIFGSESAAKAAKEQGDGMGAYVLTPRRVKLTVQFPEA